MACFKIAILNNFTATAAGDIRESWFFMGVFSQSVHGTMASQISTWFHENRN